MSKQRPVPPSIQWESVSDEELLGMRVRDLRLRIEGTVLEERIQRLYGELEAKGIGLRPPCYLADEWLTPDGVPVIGIPFYLAHPRLTQLEKKMMLEAEGEGDAWCMKLLRHETGHAFNYAYRLHRRTRWRALFGRYSTPYGSIYTARPYSRRFVVHLEDNYAQAHPDEDFAETFAVWLAPGAAWEERYRDWPALKKLRYVDTVVRRIGNTPPPVATREMLWAASRKRSTLAAYYERKRRSLRDDFPGFYDRLLVRIFHARGVHQETPAKASHFLRAHRRHLVNSISMWTNQRKFDIDKLVRRLAARSDDLGLCVHRGEIETALEVAAFFTAVMGGVRRFDWRSEEP